jgi:hypothetical protein
VVETISDETVRQALKNTLKLWQRKQWCIASVGADFVWRMEDVLDWACFGLVESGLDAIRPAFRTESD